MNKFVQSMFSNDSVTENGAITHSTSSNKCVDMFFLIGASDKLDDMDIIAMFVGAYVENPKLAVQILLWSRDCRGGAGRRRAFTVIMKFMRTAASDDLNEVYEECIIRTPELGYWKDVFNIDEPSEDSLNWLSHQLEENDNANLLAKWFPRKGPWFVGMHKYLGLTAGQFRRKLVSMSDTVEQDMCSQQWSEINYSQVPSIAGLRYRRAFTRHDEQRYTQYITDVSEGKSKVNSSVLYPHQLISPLLNNWSELTSDDAQDLDNRWNALPDCMNGTTDRILPMCDVSGSMTGLPMEISVGLGMYIAERNKGVFKNVVLTFSERPEFHEITGTDLKSRIISLSTAHWAMNTNLQKAFQVMLERAIAGKVSQDEMPTKLLIISDMEFDAAGGFNNYDAVKQQYANAGYVMPSIVFWNVNGRMGNIPVKCDTPNTALVGGYSPSILTSILSGVEITPVSIMLQAVDKPKYTI